MKRKVYITATLVICIILGLCAFIPIRVESTYICLTTDSVKTVNTNGFVGSEKITVIPSILQIELNTRGLAYKNRWYKISEGKSNLFGITLIRWGEAFGLPVLFTNQEELQNYSDSKILSLVKLLELDRYDEAIKMVVTENGHNKMLQ